MMFREEKIVFAKIKFVFFSLSIFLLFVVLNVSVNFPTEKYSCIMRILSDETSVFLGKFFRKAIYGEAVFDSDVVLWKRAIVRVVLIRVVRLLLIWWFFEFESSFCVKQGKYSLYPKIAAWSWWIFKKHALFTFDFK